MRTDIFGWFDDWKQTIPAHDPGLNGNCLICGKKLSRPLKTISLLKDGDSKSYFYRCHEACYDNTGSEDVAFIESSLIDE
jgi:hypothetical protein